MWDLLSKKYCSIQILHLCDNQISSGGAEYIGKSLSINTSLHTLKLAHNDIKDHIGIRSICKSLKSKYNNTLEELDISWNRFGVDLLACKGISSLLNDNHPTA